MLRFLSQFMSEGKKIVIYYRVSCIHSNNPNILSRPRSTLDGNRRKDDIITNEYFCEICSKYYTDINECRSHIIDHWLDSYYNGIPVPY